MVAVRSAATQLALFSDKDEPDTMSGFSVRESTRARRLSIKVFPRGRVEVVVPRRTRPAEVQAFVEAHRDWIHETRAAFAAEHPSEPSGLPASVDLPGIERRFCVRYRRDEGGRSVRYQVRGGTVILSGRTGDEALCIQALRRWLLALAKREFAPRLRALAGLTGQAYRSMHVRGQRTCWGSHSGSGTISLNFCLMFLDPAHVNYVMIHELCHARHMNHSRRFWSLVGRFEPHFRKLDADLNSSWKRIPAWLGIY